MTGEGESRVELTQRHVREGLERLERQRTLISELIRDGHHNLVPEALRFLAEMVRHQAEYEELLREWHVGYSIPPDPGLR